MAADHRRKLSYAAAVSRSARFLLCSLLFLLVAITAFLHTPLWIPWYTVPADLWPTQSVWAIVSQDARSKSHCKNSACPRVESGRGQFKDPFDQDATTVCPEYFRWIHEDLVPWKNGISRQLLESARPLGASFRVVIKDGRLYIDPYGNCYQTRAIFSLWGFVQLLKFYQGLVPDVELVFGCGDRPEVSKKDFEGRLPPPVFRYCTTREHFDIPFPDWSFWGWPEVNLKPWEEELHGIVQGAKKKKWADRHYAAFWRGNIFMGDGTRMKLKQCDGKGAQIIAQNWDEETKSRFRHSKLAEQCRNRYKVYVEGIGWSVSLKYILACNSPTLLVDPEYLEFFTRGLVPRKHYWPIRPSKLCGSIKFAVEWGNNHTHEAKELGEGGSGFVTTEVSMKHVYDFMLHTLREYAKLLDFEPKPGNLTELCPNSFLCVAPPREVPLYELSMVHKPSELRPCFLGSRDEQLIHTTVVREREIMEQVWQSEDTYWAA